MSFYTTLAYVLAEKGMTASELSEKSGLSPSYFSKLKSGHTKDVTWEKALRIIRALDMTPNEFNDVSYYVISLKDESEQE